MNTFTVSSEKGSLWGEQSLTHKMLLQLVSFKLGNEEYAIDILKVQEINRMVDITSVPNAPPYVEGVINLRGKVIPVINLREKFGLNAKETDAQSRIMVVDMDTTMVGLIVDSVSEVLRLSSDTVEPPPPMTVDNGTDYISGVGKLENRLLLLLDIEKLINNREMKNLADRNLQ